MPSQYQSCYSLSQLSLYPPNVGVQDLVSYLRYTTLGGCSGGPEVKKKTFGGSVPTIFV